jgi:amino acid transporter
VIKNNNKEIDTPRRLLSLGDVMAIIVGIVVGAGIFKTPSLVAANSGSESAMLLAWLLGGLVSIAGALCYAELVTAWPHTGGDYHYLTRAYGHRVSFLFVWARMAVIQTGSIAFLAFVFGDYASQLLPLGSYSSPLYAAFVVIGITALNVSGLQPGRWTQNLLTTVEVLGLLAVILAGLFWAVPASESVAASMPPPSSGSSGAWGLAMVFVLLTYGGWNEAAYVSAEMRGNGRKVALALLLSLGIVTALYLLVNLAYLRGLGLAGMAASQTIAADLMRRAIGGGGAELVSLLVAISALTSVNATTITGARTSYALGRDYKLFSFLGHWSGRANTPANALLVQGGVALALVLLGTLTRQGFSTIVEYTAPVFWLFFLLSGISLFVLRVKEPQVRRPFRVPLYPVTPLIFCASSLYMLWSSLVYTGVGALAGVLILLAGVPFLVWAWKGQAPLLTSEGRRKNDEPENETATDLAGALRERTGD